MWKKENSRLNPKNAYMVKRTSVTNQRTNSDATSNSLRFPLKSKAGGSVMTPKVPIPGIQGAHNAGILKETSSGS
jgi:hypothetical protein